MPLLKRKPRKRIKISKAAELIGCSSESIRNGAIGKFELVPLNPSKPRTNWLVYEADVLAFMEHQENSTR